MQREKNLKPESQNQLVQVYQVLKDELAYLEGFDSGTHDKQRYIIAIKIKSLVDLRLRVASLLFHRPSKEYRDAYNTIIDTINNNLNVL